MTGITIVLLCIIGVFIIITTLLGWFVVMSAAALKKKGKLYESQLKATVEELDKYSAELTEVNESLSAKRQSIEESEKKILTLKRTIEVLQELNKKEQTPNQDNSAGCMKVGLSDIEDINKLTMLKMSFHNPRIISKLIWETYYQKAMSTLCAEQLGVEPVIGIYKITNVLNNKSYVGQCGNVKGIAERWKEHAKCGCGIDTPATSKLYKAMLEDGLWNFRFELLEVCPKSELNVKEKFYIDLYKTKDYGYNSTIGNGKETLV